MRSETDPVTIEELEIVRAPGFETGGFEIDGFSSGVNLVHGPNAAGKTTTADSIVKVLWPDSAEVGEQHQLVGQFSLDGTQWRVDVSNGAVEYQQDGRDATAPTLPAVDQRDRYRLSLHDLLQQDTRNESLAETIKRESAGGYDLAGAHEELDYTDTPITRRKGVFQDAKEAVETWRDERDDAEGLEEDRSRLAKLHKELEEAKQARDEKAALDQAITYREAKSAYEDAEAELDGFPAVLERVDGDELRQVEDLDSDIEEWNEQKQAAEAKKQSAAGALKDAALPDDGVSGGVIERLKERRDSLEKCESREDELREALEGAKNERQSAREDIPLDTDHDALVDIELGTWAAVSEFARRAEKVQAEQQRRDTLDQWAAPEDGLESDLQSLKRASKALESWLLAGSDAALPSDGDAAVRVGTVSATVVSLAGVALGLLVHPLLFSVVLIGVALFVYGYHHRQGPENTGNGRKSHRTSFEQTGVASPASWTEDNVRNRLIEIYGALAQHKAIKERQQQRDAILAEQDLDSERNALEEKRMELREKIGAAPETADIELAVIVRRILDWQKAHDEVVALQAELDQIKANLTEARNTLQDELAAYGYDDSEDSATATQRIRDLEQRQTDHKNASRELAEAKKSIEKAKEKLDELRNKQETIFTTVDLEPDERDALQSLCENVDAYEDTKSEVNGTEAVVDQEREKLEALPAYDPDLKEEELPVLKEKLRKVEEIAARHDDLQEQISGIEAEIREAKSDTAVEKALTAKDSALGALKEQLEEDYSAMVGDLLVEHVQEETVEASRPAVFQRATELLATITRGRYKLDLVKGERTFRAYDTANQKGFKLDELSSGTRVQVLLAVRLAFVEQQEHGAKPPIILDETLANTDDLRAKVIIDSLIELATEGRQIFYFTAQSDEVAKWHTALEETAGVEWSTIDLADQDLNHPVRTPEIDSIENLTTDPPDPDGHTHDSYGKELDVETFNPHEGAGTAHLWYVVEDTEVLHDLLASGVKRWGQLQNLLDRGRAEFVPADADTIDTMQQNGEALEEFSRSWQIGQGEPVDRSVLEASGAISETFIDRVTTLATQLGGDAEQLVDALYSGEVDRFRSSKAEALEEFLQKNGHIVPREPLEDEDIRIRMIERLVEMGVPWKRAAERADKLLERVASD